MNDDFFCCTGECAQGRECPRLREQRRDSIIEKFISVLLGVLFAAVLAGYLWASWGGW